MWWVGCSLLYLLEVGLCSVVGWKTVLACSKACFIILDSVIYCCQNPLVAYLGCVCMWGLVYEVER